MNQRFLVPVLLLVTLSLGCSAPEPAPTKGLHTRDLGLERPFTTRFLEPTVVVAEDVWIEGPSDLLAHVALRQDPEAYEFRTETTRDGLLQEVRLRDTLEEGVGGRELRAELDAWSIVAYRSIRVLQRPGEAPVVLRARGDAAVLPTHGKEQRAPSIEIRGESGAR